MFVLFISFFFNFIIYFVLCCVVDTNLTPSKKAVFNFFFFILLFSSLTKAVTSLESKLFNNCTMYIGQNGKREKKVFHFLSLFFDKIFISNYYLPIFCFVNHKFTHTWICLWPQTLNLYVPNICSTKFPPLSPPPTPRSSYNLKL